MIYRTTTYYKIRRMTKKIKVVQGGQGAGKNVSIADILFEDTVKEKCITTVVSDTYDNLKDGAIADFEKLYEGMGLDWSKDYNKSSKDLTHDGGTIQFRYISDVKKQAGKSKRRQKLYINEANKIGWEVASTYIGRTHGEVYIDYNPDFEFWAHTQVPLLTDKKGNSISEQIIVTYMDNEMCPQSEIDFIESRKDNTEWYRVYGLGQTGYYSERRIYSYQFASVPDSVPRIASGMDFGVSPDPTVLIDVYLRDNNLYVDELFCLNNLMPEKIQGAERMAIVDQMELIDFQKGHQIIADSAGRTEILDLNKYGYNVKGVKKRPGSVLAGINKLRGYNIHITDRSINLKKGLENWFWKVDKNGKIIPESDGHEPDGLAALRYVIMEHNKKRSKVY
ncbi:MAG: phage terminase large subunit [Gammaproteobacteria bacterium]|nr:phage terminase large subunit [Gammaproteobacteria bacterium]